MSTVADSGTRPPEPKRPSSNRWIHRGYNPKAEGEIYDAIDGRRALVSVHFIEPPEGKGLEHHISISHLGQRPTRQMVLATLRDFGLDGAVEDNHLPGRARHFWLPLSPSERADCDCFATEKPHDEGGGFIWRSEPERTP